MLFRICAVLCNFYPRPPRGGRRVHRCSISGHIYFYPRPPRGGRRRAAAAQQAGKFISIHALREEGDVVACTAPMSAAKFLSTPSARRATVGGAGRQPTKDISIHALREEGDCPAFCGDGKADVFLSTPSARRATSRSARRCARHPISIHALREEGDSKNRDKISIFL